MSGLATQPGYVAVDGAGALVPCAVSGGGETIMAREDLAELAVQVTPNPQTLTLDP